MLLLIFHRLVYNVILYKVLGFNPGDFKRAVSAGCSRYIAASLCCYLYYLWRIK